MNYTSQEIEKADNWLSDWIKSSIKTERQKREAILVITYNQ